MAQLPALVLDTGGLLALHATERLAEILAFWTENALVTSIVLSEAIHLRDDIDRTQRVEIDWGPYLVGGTFNVIEMDSTEAELFAQFAAANLDNGESSVLAVALNRGHAAALDDKKAIREAQASSIHAITTPQLMYQWATELSVPDAEVGLALQLIERRANFLPRRANPHHAWWRGLVDNR